MKLSVRSDIVKKISNLLKSLDISGENELEFRFGFKTSKFKPSISKYDFARLNNTLRVKWDHKQVKSTVKIYSNGIRENITSDCTETIRKRKLTTIDVGKFEKYFLRLSYASEIPVSTDDISGLKPVLTRYRTRHTYFADVCKYELTEVRCHDTMNYELEIEFLQAQENISKLFDPVKYIYSLLTTVQTNINSHEKQMVIKQYNSLFGKQYSPHLFLPLRKPVNLKREHLHDLKHYAVCLKMDGVRFVLFLAESGAYLLNNKQLRKISIKVPPELFNTVLDGELVEENFRGIDILFFQGKDVQMYSLLRRLSYLTQVAEQLPYCQPIKYYHSDLHTHTQELLENTTQSDGLIFTPIKAHYRNNRTWKYKPVELLTIDFAVFKQVYDNEASYVLKVYDEDGNLAQFVGTEELPFEGIINLCYEDREFVGEIQGDIIEFRWEHDSFRPFRRREDKVLPNFVKIAQDNWEDINDPILKSTLLRLLKKTKCFGKEKIMQRYRSNLRRQKSPARLRPVDMLAPNTTEKFETPLADNLVRTGVPGEGSCLVHTMLHAISTNYRSRNGCSEKSLCQTTTCKTGSRNFYGGLEEYAQ